jgi:Glycosyl hydrolases family 35/Ricin-type beta-trefoil lectin domain-like
MSLNKNNWSLIAVFCAIFTHIFASNLALAESVLEFSVPASNGEMLEARTNAAFNYQGNKVTYDRNLFYLNGKPVFIHAGEMQYYRTPETEWEDRILKAKNSGLNCISTYVNWGIVEPVEGVFNFSGRYDLNRFLSLCQKHGMLVILRVGPIINSELRNAGLPEWVRERLPGEYHSELYPTPEWYFNAVKIYYQQLANQTKEFFPSKGGNIVMVQIDNETHVSWIWGRKETRLAAQVTINRLQHLAKEAGFEGPFSCTGWLGDLGVMAEGSLPLTGAYLLNEWNPFQPPIIDHFIIRDAHKHYDGSPIDASAQPVFSAENEGGAGYYSVTPDDYVAAYNASDIAGGVNGTSYYIFSGGTDPQRYPGPYFDLYYGEGGVCHPDDLRMSYDFSAPLGEFQQTRPTGNYIRRLGLFLQDFGGTLEQTSYLGPTVDAEILGHTNQASFRGVGASGFVFINSYKLPNDEASQPLKIKFKMGDQVESWPKHSTLTVRRNHPITLPFRLSIDDVKFRYSTASPLCRFDGIHGSQVVFYANEGDQTEFFFEGISEKDFIFQSGAKIFPHADGVAVVVNPADVDNLLVIRRAGKKPLMIKTLGERDSLRAYRLEGIKMQLLLTDLIPLNVRDGKLRFEFTPENGKDSKLQYYPAPSFSDSGFTNQWLKQMVSLNQQQIEIPFQAVGNGTYRAILDRRIIPADAKELYLTTTPITANHGAEFYVDGMLASDTYYRRDKDGFFAPWSFGVKRFLRSNSQQWVIQSQPESKHCRILNKLTGAVLTAGEVQAAYQVLLADGKQPATTNQFWEVNGDKIRNSATGLFLEAESGKTANELKLRLNKASNQAAQHWGIVHADECYSTISNMASGAILDAAIPGFLNSEPDTSCFEVMLKSFEFKPFDTAVPSFSPVKYTYGDYAQVAECSFLKEATVKFEDVKSATR